MTTTDLRQEYKNNTGESCFVTDIDDKEYGLFKEEYITFLEEKCLEQEKLITSIIGNEKSK